MGRRPATRSAMVTSLHAPRSLRIRRRSRRPPPPPSWLSGCESNRGCPSLDHLPGGNAWPIATGSSMDTVDFQIHDEFLRTSLYKARLSYHPRPLAREGSVGAVIELQGPAVHDGGTVRAAVSSPTDSISVETHDRSRIADRSVLWLVGSVRLGVPRAVVRSA